MPRNCENYVFLNRKYPIPRFELIPSPEKHLTRKKPVATY